MGAQVLQDGRLPEEDLLPAQHQEVDRQQAQQQHVALKAILQYNHLGVHKPSLKHLKYICTQLKHDDEAQHDEIVHCNPRGARVLLRPHPQNVKLAVRNR